MSRHRPLWLASALALILVVGLAPVVGGDQARPVPPPLRVAPEPELHLVEGSGAEPAAPDLAAAVPAAAQLGQPVEIAELTTEHVRHLANPDGTVRFESYAVPQRVRRGDGWVPVDATLRRDGGRVAPAATLLEVSFSAGGTDTLVRMVDGDRRLELSWPAPLPEPRLDGATATYPDVLPGVDLVIEADVESFSQVLRVRDRAAARNPGLARLVWRVSAAGLAVRVDDAGAVEATDPATGEVVFAAPPAAMWDSPGTPTQLDHLMGRDGSRWEPEPGLVQVIPTELTGGNLVVLPDVALLADPQIRYPVYIDPSFGRGQRNWATVHKQQAGSGWTSDSAWPRQGGMRVGLCTWPGCDSATGLWRSVVRFSIDGLDGRHVSRSKVYMTQTHSGGCDASYLQLWRVAAFTNGVSWNGVDWMYGEYLQRKSVKSANSTGCGASNPNRLVTFDGSNVRTRVQSAANNENATISFGVRSNNESSRNQWRRIHRDSLVLEVEYDAYPNTPTSVTIAGGDADCHGSCSSPATVRVTRPYLQGRVSKSFSGNVRAEFELRNFATGAVVATNTASSKAAPATFQWRAPSLSNGTQYRFRVRGVNAAGGTGPWSSYFRFTVNTAGPGAPTQLGIDSTGDCFGACTSPAMLNNRRPTFRATPQHALGDDATAVFEVWDNTRATLVAAGTVSHASAGNKATWRPPSNLPQEQTMHLRVRSTADKHGRSGSWSPYFTFTVDTGAPNPPTVSSLLYAHKDSGTWNGGVGRAGVFEFGPSGADDVVTYQWRFNGGTVASANVDKGAAHTVSLTPPGDLEQVLEVRSIDQAGNTSGWRAYPFYVRPQPADTGYWKFDEGTGGTAGSASGDGQFTGQLGGGAGWAASGINPGDPAASGNAVSLNGTDAYVEMPPVLATNHAAGFTVSAWVNPTDLSSDRTVVAQRGDDTYMFRLYYRSVSGQWCYEVRNSDSASAGVTRACSSLTPQTGQWTHLVGVYDNPAGQLRLWVNGGPNNGLPQAGTVTTVAAPPAWASTGSFEVGRAVASDYLAGRVDEVRAYQRVVDEFEVIHVFRSCLDNGCPPVPEPQDLLLVGAWDFEETSGGVAEDGSQLGNHATLHGSAERTAFGYRDSRGIWIGSQNAYLATDDPVVLTDQSFTVSAWVRLDELATPGTQQFVVQTPGMDASAMKLFYDPTVEAWRFEVSWHDGTSTTWYRVTASTPVQAGVWTHLAGIYDAAAGALRLYVDGQLAADRVGVAVQAATGGTQIGGEPNFNQLRGTIDTVRAFQGAASDARVAEWYEDQLAPPAGSQPPQLIGDWRLDDAAGDSVFDHIWSGNDGIRSGGATWPAGGGYAGGYGLDFDGSSGQVTTAWSPVLTDRSFSVSAWVNLASTNSSRTAVAIEGQSGAAFELGYDAGASALCFRMRHADQVSAPASAACAAGAPATGAWTHVVGVFDKRERTVSLYVDGQLAGTAAYGGLDPWQAIGPLVIGRGPAGWWSGGVALVQAYQGQLAEAAVAALYAQQRDTTPSAVITAPGTGQWSAGDQIGFAGHGADLAGPVPASALSWELRARGCGDMSDPACELDVLQTWSGVAGGSFDAPDVVDPVWLELELTVDNGGLAPTSAVVQLAPATVTLTFESDPEGLELQVGGATVEAPFEITVVQGATVPVGALSPQDLDVGQQDDGVTFLFDGWAHGGGASQSVTAPATATTYTASFVEEDLGTPSVVSYEAEAPGNTLGGTASVVPFAGASDGSVVDGAGSGAGNFVQFNDVMSESTGLVGLTVHYVAEEDRPATMSINGGDPVTVLFPGSGDAAVVEELTFGVEVTAGANTIRFSHPSEQAPAFDRVLVEPDPVDPLPPPTPGESYEAEASGNTLGGTASVVPLVGASGGVVVEGVGGSTANFVQFNGVVADAAGQVGLTVHYFAAEDRPATITVNGGSPAMLIFPGTGDTVTRGELTFGVELAAGANTIRFTHPSAEAPAFDRIVVETGPVSPPAVRANLAWDAPVLASGQCSGTDGPEQAVNGSWTAGLDDRWCSETNPPWSIVHWLQLDLGQVTGIGNVTVRHAGAGGEPSALNTSDFLVKVSEDGQNWVTVVDVAGNTTDVTSHDMASAGRYVRLDVLRPNDGTDDVARIYDIEVYADPLGAPPAPAEQLNLAWGRPAAADSACSGTDGPENAFNGSWSGGYDDRWCSETNPPWSHAIWLQVDLGGTRQIGNVTLRHAGAGGEDSSLNTRDFQIKVSADGQNWVTVVDVEGNVDDVTSHDLTSTGRYVRLDVLTPTSASDPAARIYEIEVFADPVGDPPAPHEAPENLAWARPVSSDSACSGTDGPERAVNGSWTGGPDDRWCSQTDPPFSHAIWMWVDLGEVSSIGNITVRHAGAGGEHPALNTRDFLVKVSADGLNWVTAVEVEGNSADVTSHDVAVSGRFVRLDVLTPNSAADPAARIYHLEVFADSVGSPPDPPEHTNLAWGQPVTSDSACSGTEGPEKAVNGSWTAGPNDRWCSMTNPPWSTEIWLRVDLGEVVDIDTVILRHAGAGGEGSGWNTRDFSLSVSDDGVTWTAVATVTGNTDDVTSHVVGTSGRFVRLDVTTPTGDSDPSARIYALEVYGSA